MMAWSSIFPSIVSDARKPRQREYFSSHLPIHRTIGQQRSARDLCSPSGGSTQPVGNRSPGCCSGAPSVPAEQVLDGVRVIRVRYWIPRWQTLAVGLAGIMPNLKTRPWLVFQALALTAALVWASCRASKHRDLINAYWLYPSGIAWAMAGRFRRIPLVVTSQGGDRNLRGQSRFLRAIARAVAKSADSCVGVSRALCCRFMDLGVPAERISLISSIRGETGHCAAFSALRQLFRIQDSLPGKSDPTQVRAESGRGTPRRQSESTEWMSVRDPATRRPGGHS